MPPSPTRFAIMVDGANLWYGLMATHKRERTPAALGRMLRHLTRIVIEREDGGIVASRDIFFIDEPNFRRCEAEAARSGFTVHFVAAPQLNDRQRAKGHSRADDNALKRHAIDTVQRFDALLLVSNDGDFVPLVEQMQTAGRRIAVGSYETTGARPLRLSRELKKAANEVLSLRAFADVEIAMPDDDPMLPDPPVTGSKVKVFRGPSLIEEVEVGHPIIEVGRASKSRDHRPDIDLTEEDQKTILSRQHLLLRFLGPGRAVAQIHLRCTSPTWYNGHLLRPGENVLVTADDELQLGDDHEGFQLLIEPI